jgi:hypothetical protein
VVLADSLPQRCSHLQDHWVQQLVAAAAAVLLLLLLPGC